MHGEAIVVYFLGQVVVDNLFDHGVEAKARKQLGLIFDYCYYYYCILLLF
jgi:hypothetical protein